MMRRHLQFFFIALLFCGSVVGFAAEKRHPKSKEITPATVVKVLTHLVDLNGKHSESPSLYERDGYQVFLRANPDRVSTMRFDIQWKAKIKRPEGFILRVELRGSKMELSKMATFEKKVEQPRFLTKWSRIELTPEQFKAMGEPLAWRVSIWDGPNMAGVQESFLW